MTVDPTGTLIRAALASLTCGAGWAMLAVAAIYAGSRFLPPRIPAGEIWAQWRRRRILWGFSLFFTLAGAVATGIWLQQAVGQRDLYWITRTGELAGLTQLGAACGYLLTLLAVVVVGLLRRRARG